MSAPVQMPDAIYAIPEFVGRAGGQPGTYVGTGTWIDEIDGSDCTRYIRASLYSDQARELVERLELTRQTEDRWQHYLLVPNLRDDVLALLRQIGGEKPQVDRTKEPSPYDPATWPRPKR